MLRAVPRITVSRLWEEFVEQRHDDPCFTYNSAVHLLYFLSRMCFLNEELKERWLKPDFNFNNNSLLVLNFCTN